MLKTIVLCDLIQEKNRFQQLLERNKNDFINCNRYR